MKNYTPTTRNFSQSVPNVEVTDTNHADNINAGVYVPDRMNYRGEWYDLKAIKKAKRKDRSRPVSEMLLMMFRSAARDRTTGK